MSSQTRAEGLFTVRESRGTGGRVLCRGGRVLWDFLRVVLGLYLPTSSVYVGEFVIPSWRAPPRVGRYIHVLGLR